MRLTALGVGHRRPPTNGTPSPAQRMTRTGPVLGPHPSRAVHLIQVSLVVKGRELRMDGRPQPDTSFVLLATTHHVCGNASVVEGVVDLWGSCVHDVGHQSAPVVMGLLGTVTTPVPHPAVLHCVEHLIVGDRVVRLEVLLRQVAMVNCLPE